MGWGRRPVVRKDTSASLLIGKDGDNFLEFEGDEHVALLARTGTGKTSGFTIPNCFHWPHSLVVLDIKGEAYEATAGYREKMLGQRIFRFDPTSHDQRSHCWNPLDAIDRPASTRLSDQAIRQADLLIAEPGADDKDRFWQRKARMSLAAVLMMLAQMPDQPMTYENVFSLFQRGDGLRLLARRVMESRTGKRPLFTQKTINAVSDYIGRGERLTEDVRASVSSNLLAWMNEHIVTATNRSDFDLRDLRRYPTTLYITVSPASIERISPLLRLLFGSIVNLNTDLTPHQDPSSNIPLLVVLDEFVRLGAMPALTSAAQFARGYGIRLAYVIQDKAQLQGLYGQSSAADVFNNLGAEIVFGLADVRQAKEYEERMGNETRLAPTLSAARFFRWFKIGRMGESQTPMGRPLMYAFEIVQMPEDQQLLMRAGMRPMKSQRIRYFNEPYFMDRVMDPPETPLLPVAVSMDDRTVEFPRL